MSSSIQTVSNINFFTYIILQESQNSRYKTVLCKHFDSPQGCSYGEKCQFAHGKHELRFLDNKISPNFSNKVTSNQRNALNYKIVKCKNWEKDGTCKYGGHCTFAHGSKDLRNRSDNLIKMQPGTGMMVQPFMMNMQNVMKMGQMNQLQGVDLGFSPLMMGMGVHPNNELQKQINENINPNMEKSE